VSVKPISPDSIIGGKTATILQEEVVERIICKYKYTVERSEIFDKGWLDIEDIFEGVGWKVEYDKPSYCDSYPASFTFKKP
jgi:hypothetical protein